MWNIYVSLDIITFSVHFFKSQLTFLRMKMVSFLSLKKAVFQADAYCCLVHSGMFPLSFFLDYKGGT